MSDRIVCKRNENTLESVVRYAWVWKHSLSDTIDAILMLLKFLLKGIEFRKEYN